MPGKQEQVVGVGPFVGGDDLRRESGGDDAPGRPEVRVVAVDLERDVAIARAASLVPDAVRNTTESLSDTKLIGKMCARPSRQTASRPTTVAAINSQHSATDSSSVVKWSDILEPSGFDCFFTQHAGSVVLVFGTNVPSQTADGLVQPSSSTAGLPPEHRLSRVRQMPIATDAEVVLDHIGSGADLIVPLANGEPVTLIDAIEAHGDQLTGVRVHQMHAVHDRRYLHGAFGDRLRHVSYFLSHVTRPCFHAGTIDLVPNNFSEMRTILAERTVDPLVLAAASPPDRHGYFSLGLNADYVSSFIGRARFFLEANVQMPRTFGRNQIHISQVLGWVDVDRALVEVTPPTRSSIDDRIAGFVAERIPDEATIQTGIGSIPNAVLSALSGHRGLGVHTELLSDGVMDLVEGGVVNGVAKQLNRTKAVGTFALGTRRLYDFLDENAGCELLPVSYVNDPRVIAQEDGFVSINSTIAVDLLGQCASETVDGRYYSSSGGQADFARGAMYSEGGQGFVVLTSTAKQDTISKIVAELSPGDVVTTLKNTVDKVVTEWGVAELRGRSLRQRAEALMAIAHPMHRDRLRAEAVAIGHV